MNNVRLSVILLLVCTSSLTFADPPDVPAGSPAQQDEKEAERNQSGRSQQQPQQQPRNDSRSNGTPQGSFVFPGKFFATVHALGVATTFDFPTFPIYKMALNFGGRIASLSKVTIWLGGELNIGGRENYALLEPGIFVMITLEKLLTIPLVPFVRAGIAGGAGVHFGYNNGGFNGNTTDGAVWLKVGGGLHYFVTKNIGLGGETGFAFGPGFRVDPNNRLFTGFSGYWEFLAGMRAHF